MTLLVVTKADLIAAPASSDLLQHTAERLKNSAQEMNLHMRGVAVTSAAKLTGIAELKLAITHAISSNSTATSNEFVHQTAVRSMQSVTRAIEAISAALDAAREEVGEEIVASELRIALDDLSAIIGEVHTDDILGEIFSRFCIGK
jgi:tRNA U34 5-carboxymethylaminomethyl modifying GTPase MnmE/TrmE